VLKVSCSNGDNKSGFVCDRLSKENLLQRKTEVSTPGKQGKPNEDE